MIEKTVKYKGKAYKVKMLPEMYGDLEAEYMNAFYSCVDTKLVEKGVNGKPNKFENTFRTADFNPFRRKAFDGLIVDIEGLERMGTDNEMHTINASTNGKTLEKFPGVTKWTDLVYVKIKETVMDEVYDQALLESAEIEEAETKKK